MTRVGIAILTILLSANASAQLPAANGVIEGTVTEQGSSIAAASVLVHLTSADPKPRYWQVRSDDAGHFQFTELPYTRFKVQIDETRTRSTTRIGRLPSACVASVDGPKPVICNLEQLNPAVITGKVTDEDGNPIRNAKVVAGLRTSPWIPFQAASSEELTNERGEYRLRDVSPGLYQIRVVGPSPPNDAKSAFPTVFFPGVSSPADAARVSLKPGD